MRPTSGPIVYILIGRSIYLDSLVSSAVSSHGVPECRKKRGRGGVTWFYSTGQSVSYLIRHI
jgi:hypothetical protein